MEQFYKSFFDILSYLAGETLPIKPLTQLSAEITELIGLAEWSWIPYFLDPINVLSLFVYGGFMYAACFIILYAPWQLLRMVMGIKRRHEKRR